jgi:hypothetical protein
MDYDELRRYLDVSLAHSVVVDVRELSEAPGYLRTITVHQDGRVTIEFPPAREYAQGDFEGGGLKYVGQYETLDELIEVLEEYLGSPVGKWRNFTAAPYEPHTLDEPDSAANIRYFEDLVRTRSVALPSRGHFTLTGIHWRHIELYGEYRADKLGEETELLLRQQGIGPDDEDEEMP